MNIFANVIFLVLVFFMGYMLGFNDGRAAAIRMQRRARAQEKLTQARAKLDRDRNGGSGGVFISEPITSGHGDE